jgi:uncharacterized membrane protein YuzA (DUF378 family)
MCYAIKQFIYDFVKKEQLRMDVINYFKNFDYKDVNGYRPIAYVLLIIGGINWGLVALGTNLVYAIFGNLFARLIYLIIGVAAGYECYMFYVEKFAKKPPTNG